VIRLIDTYPDFRRTVGSLGSRDVAEVWLKYYMRKYEELLRLQVKCHGSLGNAVKTARKLLKPLVKSLDALDKAWENSYRAIPMISKRFSRLWRLPDVSIVLYVGSGCGAGWATEYEGTYSILLGLEMVINHGWESLEDLSGLIAHELCHILHMQLRGLKPDEFEALEGDPLFLLYSEGFAMKCEHLVTGRLWRIASEGDWLGFCESERGRLAKSYLEVARRGGPLTKFYGSWGGVEGYTQTGYYLGHEYIEYLLTTKFGSIEDVARMELGEIRSSAMEFLKALAKATLGNEYRG